MKMFLLRRGGYWLLQWWRLLCAVIGILSLGLLDFGFKGECAYLDAMASAHGIKKELP